MIEKLKLIVGNAILNSPSEDDIVRLAKLITYYNTQLKCIKELPEAELKDYINSVIEQAESFLK